jgi:hypothetical protein
VLESIEMAYTPWNAQFPAWEREKSDHFGNFQKKMRYEGRKEGLCKIGPGKEEASEWL